MRPPLHIRPEVMSGGYCRLRHGQMSNFFTGQSNNAPVRKTGSSQLWPGCSWLPKSV